VLFVVVDGAVTVTVDGRVRLLAGTDALVVGKRRRRRMTAYRSGVRYLLVHLGRGLLPIDSAVDRRQAERRDAPLPPDR
jgi:hypothetical protein